MTEACARVPLGVRVRLSSSVKGWKHDTHPQRLGLRWQNHTPPRVIPGVGNGHSFPGVVFPAPEALRLAWTL